MKTGKWNYTEDIEFDVILVRLHQVKEPPMHWQNAFAGQERQVVRIKYNSNGVAKFFYIDNQDGSGIQKIIAGGGPGSYSAHVERFDIIRELPESEWQVWDPHLHRIYRNACDDWQKEHYPEEFERMEGLRITILQMRNDKP